MREEMALAIMMTFKSCRMRQPGKVKIPTTVRVRFDRQVFQDEKRHLSKHNAVSY